MRKLRIAVIGSGISGLSCAWLLSQRHDVTVIEADGRLGGHANTVDVKAGNRTIPVDTGFIVSNTLTYPNFAALMDYLDVAMINAPMSFSVSADNGRYEYSGDNLGTLLGSRRQWFEPSHWRMIADLLRFYRTIEEDAKDIPGDVTLGQYLEARGYGETFARRHILPMAGAIWSAAPHEIAAYPLQAFVRFFSNHRLFALGARPNWQTVKGGSRVYVQKLVEDSRFTALHSAPVAAIARHAYGVAVKLRSGAVADFDHVVLATHGDMALDLLSDPTAEERHLLSAFKTSENRVILHRDAALMPRTRRFWSAWNYRGTAKGQESKLAVTYWMNALQDLPSPEQHFVSLNPAQMPDPDLVDARFACRHPVFSRETLAAQEKLWSLQGVNRTWFCGAWFGAGFHEDGLQAGLAVAEQLGGLQRPWIVENPSGRIHVTALQQPVEPVFVQAAE